MEFPIVVCNDDSFHSRTVVMISFYTFAAARNMMKHYIYCVYSGSFLDSSRGRQLLATCLETDHTDIEYF